MPASYYATPTQLQEPMHTNEGFSGCARQRRRWPCGIQREAAGLLWVFELMMFEALLSWDEWIPSPGVIQPQLCHSASKGHAERDLRHGDVMPAKLKPILRFQASGLMDYYSSLSKGHHAASDCNGNYRAADVLSNFGGAR